MTSFVRRMAIGLSGALLLVLTQAGIAHADDPWINDPAGTLAREVQPIYWTLFFFAVIVLILIDGGIVWSAVRYRDRPGRIAKQFHGHNMLELTWTLVPTVLVIFFSVISFQKLQLINDTATDADMVVQAEGVQWSWNYKYPQEDRFRLENGTYLTGAEELHVLVGEKVRIELSSPDVIHSFFVQQIGGKKDAVPGRKTEVWVRAERPGVYKGQCAEFCGDGHADMLIVLHAHDEAGYAQWLREAIDFANLLNDPEVAQGREIFRNQACAGCHVVRGLTGGRIGPELTNIASQPNVADLPQLSPVNVENLKAWINDPQGLKPGTLMPKVPLTPDELDAVAKFLAVLK